MRKRKTTEEFIEQAKAIHGDKYDYSKLEYKGCKVKVCIICPEHGEFWQTPDNHVNNKQGCPKCANNIKLTTQEFIEKARKIHGDKYDYSKVNYINNHTNIIIICSIHGEFDQLPLNHLKGEGCYKCGRKITDDSKRLTKEEILNNAFKTHGNKYDYSLLDFSKKVSEKNIIICPKHGKFEQTLANHFRGCGCPKCNESKGEKFITNWLSAKNINFISQYKINIDTKINQSGYAFIDFYLPDYNIFIEYNGKQHYTIVNKFGGELQYQRQIKRDQFIRDYCNSNNIRLLEIKYDENINDKLNYEL